MSSPLAETGQQFIGTPLDYTIVVIYFIGILLFGAYFAKYSKSTKDFFFGGQRFSWWLIAASLVATGIGSYSFIKYAQAGFTYGLSSTMTYLNDWLMIPLFMFGWLPIIYFSRIKSVPEYFDRRFGLAARRFATFYSLMYMIGYIGLNFYLLGTAIHGLMPQVTVFQAAFVVAIISAIYVTAGGQTAVIFTDLVQGVFLYIAGAILLFLGLSHLGGFTEWWQNMDVAHRLPFPGFNEPADFNFSSIFWGEGIIGTLAFTFVNQGFIMRYLAVKNVSEGRKCLTFNTLLLMPISAIVVGNVGWIAYSMMVKGQLEIPDNYDTRDIFIYTANIICKPGIFGFVIAALTAALMSTIDTLINACTAISVYDIYKPMIRQDAPDKHYLNVARIFSIAFSFLGILLVPVFQNWSKNIFAAHYAFVALAGPPMLVPIFLGVLWKRFTPKAAVWSMAIGGILMIYAGFNPSLAQPFAKTHNISDGTTLNIVWHTVGDNPWPNEVRFARTSKFKGNPTSEYVAEYNTGERARKPFDIAASNVYMKNSGNRTYKYAAEFSMESGKTYSVRLSGAKGYGRFSKDLSIDIPADAENTVFLTWTCSESNGVPENMKIEKIDPADGWNPSGIASAEATLESRPFTQKTGSITWVDEKRPNIRYYGATLTGLEPMTKYSVRVGNPSTGNMSWDLTFKTGGEYKYFRGVYGLFVMLILCIGISLFTKPKPEEEIVGLTLWSIRKQKEIFKGGKLNEARGKPVKLLLKHGADDDLLHLPESAMKTLKAEVGDLMYIADGRKYLGGLRSLHIHLGEPHSNGEMALISTEKAFEGDLFVDRDAIVEKVF